MSATTAPAAASASIAVPSRGAITGVFRRVAPPKANASQVPPGGAEHAATLPRKRCGHQRRRARRMPGILWLPHHAGTSEVAEAAALYFPEVGGTFVQAESETASINMVYGAASAGVRVMTASSGPGLSLMQEENLVSCRRGTAVASDRRCHAWRTWPRQHRARAERLLRDGQRRRARQLSKPRRRARVGAGDGGPDHLGL